MPGTGLSLCEGISGLQIRRPSVTKHSMLVTSKASNVQDLYSKISSHLAIHNLVSTIGFSLTATRNGSGTEQNRMKPFLDCSLAVPLVKGTV